MSGRFCSPSSSGKRPPAERIDSQYSVLDNKPSCPVLAPTSHLATYPQGLQVREVGLGAEEHIVGHAEALAHTQVVEQGGLCQGIAHFQHHHI